VNIEIRRALRLSCWQLLKAMEMCVKYSSTMEWNWKPNQNERKILLFLSHVLLVDMKWSNYFSIEELTKNIEMSLTILLSVWLPLEDMSTSLNFFLITYVI